MVRCDTSQSLATIVLESDTQTEYGCEVECKINKNRANEIMRTLEKMIIIDKNNIVPYDLKEIEMIREQYE